MVVKNKDEIKPKKENIGQKIGLWIARIIVLILFLYLAGILFNYFPLLPVYGATYLPLDRKLFKGFFPAQSETNTAAGEVTSSAEQTGGADQVNSPWGGNITDLIDLYRNVWDELKKNEDMKFNLTGGTANKTVGDLISAEKTRRGELNLKISAEDTVLSDIIKNMLRNPATMSTIRDRLSKKSKHFFASIPITAALLKIAEFTGITEINASGGVVDNTNLGIGKNSVYLNPEKKRLSIAELCIEQDGGEFASKTVYDVNKLCTKSMIFWYLKQFAVVVGSTLGAIFMWPIYYLHEVEIVQEARLSETGKVEPCNSGGSGKALYIIILILGLLFMAYNAYARFYSFFDSLISIFMTEKTVNDIVLWGSIASGVGIAALGFVFYRNFAAARAKASEVLNTGKRAGSQIMSVLSQPLLRGLIDHYGLIKSAFICLVGAVILGSIWSMTLTGSWPLLAIVAFFFPIAGLILIYLTQSEMATLFEGASLTKDHKTESFNFNKNSDFSSARGNNQQDRK